MNAVKLYICVTYPHIDKLVFGFKIIPMKKSVISLAASSALLAGCAIPESELPSGDLFEFSQTETLRQGHAVVLEALQDSVAKRGLQRVFEGQNNRGDDGFDTTAAPVVDTSKTYIGLQVRTTEGSLNNDLACDVLSVDLSSVEDKANAYIVALLTGGQDEKASLAWVEPDLAHVCFEEGERYHLFMYVSEEPR